MAFAEISVPYLAHGLARTLGARYVNVLDHGISSAQVQVAPGQRAIFACGTFAWGEWQPGDNVGLVCLADCSDAVFWAIVQENLRLKDDFKGSSSNVVDLSSSSLAGVDNVHPLVKKIASFCRSERYCSFFLHFARIKPRVDLSKATSTISAHSMGLIRDLLQVVKDMDSIGCPSLPPIYREVYKTIRYCADVYGLFGPQYGYFDGQTLLWSVHNVYMELARKHRGGDHSTFDVDVKHLLDEVFNVLIRAVEQSSSQTYSLRIATPSGLPATSHMSAEAILTIREVLQQISRDGSSKTDIRDGWEDFKAQCNNFLEVEFEIWAQSVSQQEQFKAIVIDRLKDVASVVFALHDISNGKQHKKQYARIWPDVLVKKTHNGRTIYAVGIIPFPKTIAEGDEAIKRYTRAAALSAQGFIENKFPTSDGLITVRYINREELDDFLPASIAGDAPTAPESITSASSPRGTLRFRTAAQAISRLRYDPGHAGIQYDLAYEDRFAGLVWVPLESWGGKAVEEEDFVPGHRVRTIRRRIDWKVVWDRMDRVDLT